VGVNKESIEMAAIYYTGKNAGIFVAIFYFSLLELQGFHFVYVCSMHG